jgi:hypothetical protein
MTGCSAFKRCGNGFRCSSRRPLGEVLYRQIVESNGGVYQDESFSGPVAARAFALAMTVARARSTLERAKNQADPLKVYDLLTSKERHYGLAPDASDTLAERRAALAAAMQLTLGPKRGNVEYQLRTALGDDFKAWLTTPASSATHFPYRPWLSVGLFRDPGPWKTITLTDSIADRHGDHLVNWTHDAGDTGGLFPGDQLVVEPGKLGQQELVTVGSPTSATFRARFARPHESGVMAIRRPWPFWCNTSLHSLVVVTNGRARDPIIRDKVRRLLHKLLGATSTWDVVEESTTPGETGGFVPGLGEPNITPIQLRTF